MHLKKTWRSFLNLGRPTVVHDATDPASPGHHRCVSVQGDQGTSGSWRTVLSPGSRH